MTTRQALLDIILQQQETINLLRDTARHNYRLDTETIEVTAEYAIYWIKRADEAEKELSNLKLFDKK